VIPADSVAAGGNDGPAPAGGADGARGVGALTGGDCGRTASRSMLYPSYISKQDSWSALLDLEKASAQALLFEFTRDDRWGERTNPSVGTRRHRRVLQEIFIVAGHGGREEGEDSVAGQITM
jgi:hypothetical protein